MRRLPHTGSGAASSEEACERGVDLGGREEERRIKEALKWRSRRAFLLVGLVLFGIVGLLPFWIFSTQPPPATTVSQIQALKSDGGVRGGGQEEDNVHSEYMAQTLAPVAASSSPPRRRTTVKPKSTTKQQKGEFDDILEELLTLHRNDVAAREAEEIASVPADTPVYSADDVLVATLADRGYGDCAVRLVESMRDVGRWGGAVAVLVPKEGGSGPLEEGVLARLKELRADIIPAALETGGGADVRGAGSVVQYAKNSLLVEDAFRKYETIVFLDADGLARSPLRPLITLSLPEGRVAALPTWPTAMGKHDSFYTREVNLAALSSEEEAQLREAAPDRTLVGITAWFLLKPKRLPPPAVMQTQIREALGKWRHAFRFNDQGLWNVLFYNTGAFFPLCLAQPPLAAEGDHEASPPEPWNPLLFDNLDNLASAIESACGSSYKRRRQIYEHNLKDCVPAAEWERKRRANAELPEAVKADLRKWG